MNEALTNLFVGVCRFQRGEKLAAMRMVQQAAVDRILDLVYREYIPDDESMDVYLPERRIEMRYPPIQALLTDFCPGYQHTLSAVENILTWLEKNYFPSAAMVHEIRRLASS